MIDFRLHTLGWQAFQNLCFHILREHLGQTVQVFPPGNDGGRDGAFRGLWQPAGNETFSGSFTVQCKHTSRSSHSLRASDLQDELTKAQKLAQQCLADNYILITNATMTASQQAQAKSHFADVGIANFIAFDKIWLNHTISTNRRLRSLVPRVYGLGDLSEILDDRAYRQAKTLFASIETDLRNFVPTAAYRKAAQALEKARFVALIGSPGTGKSAIAATLCLYAADSWKTRTIKIAGPQDFERHWNPDSSDQVFWIDDAFGATQYEANLTQRWNQYLLSLNAAIRRGSRIIITSRDYIYERAKTEIKHSSFPLLSNIQVIVRVEDLSTQEKRQILYNHIRNGNQSKSLRTLLKPHLSDAAQNSQFSPELARRLGNSAFTRSLKCSNEGIQYFFTQPMAYLTEIISSLSSDETATLALLFVKGGHLKSPLRITNDDVDIIRRLGGRDRETAACLQSMRNVFTRLMYTDEGRLWEFQHPTIRDAMRAFVKSNEDLLDVYISGTRTAELFSEVVCGTVDMIGEAVTIPRDQYQLIVDRLMVALNGRAEERQQCYSFLATRCSERFLQEFLQQYPSFIDDHLSGSVDVADPRTSLVVSLHSAGILPDRIRTPFVTNALEHAIDWVSSDILADRFRPIITDAEWNRFVDQVYDEVLMGAGNHTEWIRDNAPVDPDQIESHFEDHISELEAFLVLFEGESRYERASMVVGREIDRIREDVVWGELEKFREEWDENPYDEEWPDSSGQDGDSHQQRDMFDDVDA